MAQSYTTDSGELTIPGAYASYEVAGGASGLSTNGVLMLVGEADAGPRFSLETNIAETLAFGPNQFSEVKAKFQGGPLVDGFFRAAAPANDETLPGAPNRIILIKTNNSQKAKSALSAYGGGAYQTADGNDIFLADRSYGKLGNLIYFTNTARTAEVIPTTGSFTWLLPIGATDVGVRVNGGAQLTANLSALTTPAQAQAALNALSGVAATGGTSRALLTGVSGNLSLTIVSGNRVQIDYDENFDGTTSAGDTFYIPSTSAIKGGSNQNVGSYVVISSTSNSIVATKLMDASGTPGTLTSPVAVSSTAVAATTDVQAWAPVTVTLEAGDPLAGIGKSLEICELTSAADRLSNLAYTLNTSKVTWISKTSTPKLIVSGAEYRLRLNVNRQRDNIQEDLDAGGEIALKIGYQGTTASLTITESTLTTTVTGGSGTDLELDLKDFPTIQDVATYINSKTGYKCVVGTAILGQLPSGALDNVTAMGIATTFGEYAGRIKIDAYRFFKVVSNSALTQLQDEDDTLLVQRDGTTETILGGCGLPAPQTSITFLAGGTKGGTSDADVTEALAALERVRGNFLIPLFSRDATADISDRLTDSSSTYTISAIHTAARTHVNEMSKLKRRRPRQALLSYRSTFLDSRLTASNIASARCVVTFQDIRTQSGSDSAIKQFHPWMGGVIAAGMQAAGGYRGILNKTPNLNAALQAARDFDDQDDTAMEDALKSGLMPLRKLEGGTSYEWVSDQTSYGKDSNFVYNSLQAIYAADVTSMTLSTRIERMFKGKAASEITAAMALDALDTVMGELLGLKWIAVSDDAPKGYKNPSVKLGGPALKYSLEIKIATLLYFFPIHFLVSPVEQSA